MMAVLKGLPEKFQVCYEAGTGDDWSKNGLTPRRNWHTTYFR